MSDFDDFIDFLTNVIDEAIDKVPDGSEIADHVQNTMHLILDKVSDSEFEIDDEHKQMLIVKLADAMHISQNEVSEQLETMSKVNADSFKDVVSHKVSDITISDDNKWNGEFTSIGCWDECIATTKDASKRIACGYRL